MNLQLIRTLRTVIEIWDDDFGKDQFLAGVMFTMSSFNLSTEVELTVPLYSGLNSNLVSIRVSKLEGVDFRLFGKIDIYGTYLANTGKNNLYLRESKKKSILSIFCLTSF